MFTILLLCGAGFLAGALNAVAGGGTFLTFPALVYLGIPPIAANATATVAALPGYLGGAFAFRRDVRAEGALSLLEILLVAALGSAAGAALLLVTPAQLFQGAVPWLLLVATLAFALGPRLLIWLRNRGAAAGRKLSIAAILAVSIYGGYFNGGLGIMLLAAFGLIGFMNLNGMNGLKNLLSALLSVISASAFAIAGIVAWQEAAIMAVAAALGGYGGAWVARRIRRSDYLRAGIVAIGCAMTVAFFLT